MTSKQYNGYSWFKSDNEYYKRICSRRQTSVYLHRQIWEDEVGTIPKGHQIHHKDGDKGNNCITNLECLSVKEHRAHHPIKDMEKQNKHLASIRPLTKEWHASKEGHEWHKKQFAKTLGKLFVNKDKICQVCEAEYTVFSSNNVSKYCSNKCKSKAFRTKNPEKAKSYRKKREFTTN